jgi:hypothetical protein
MAHGSPPLSRRRLEQILGLEPGAPTTEIMRASVSLVRRLELRRERADPDQRAALNTEIDGVLAAVAAALDSEVGASGAASAAQTAALSSLMARERLLLGAIGLLGIVVLGFSVAWLQRMGSSASDAQRLEPAMLIVESRPEDAWLRIRPAEGEELLQKIPGIGAAVELPAGRYAIEVSREDCPDVYALEIDLEPGETRRYEPTICVGAGELVVRSNVSGDRLRIDALDLGETRPEPHLLGVGDHRVRVDKPGFVPFEGVVRIRPDERLELRAELVAGSGESGGNDGSGPKGAAGGGNGNIAHGAAGGGNGNIAQGAAGATLLFQVVAPSQPPGTSTRGANPGFPGDRQPLVPEPTPPERIRPEDLSLPKDFASASTSLHLPKGGSTTWHDAVSSRILSRFDADGSGRIDRVSETEAIPCSFWKEIEQSFDEGRLGLSMSRLYGFDGSEWHPKALGFSRAQRGLAYERMKACGLAP